MSNKGSLRVGGAAAERHAAVAKSANTIGRSSPLGATVSAAGVNFSLFSRSAAGIELLLFDHRDDAVASKTIPFDPAANRTYHYWHCFVPELRPGQIYAYRVQGRKEPERGLWFDADKVLLDPHGRGVVVPAGYDRQSANRQFPMLVPKRRGERPRK